MGRPQKDYKVLYNKKLLFVGKKYDVASFLGCSVQYLESHMYFEKDIYGMKVIPASEKDFEEYEKIVEQNKRKKPKGHIAVRCSSGVRFQ